MDTNAPDNSKRREAVGRKDPQGGNTRRKTKQSKEVRDPRHRVARRGTGRTQERRRGGRGREGGKGKQREEGRGRERAAAIQTQNQECANHITPKAQYQIRRQDKTRTRGTETAETSTGQNEGRARRRTINKRNQSDPDHTTGRRRTYGSAAQPET